MMINWRESPRFALHVPLWIRPMDFSQTPSQRAETSNISASGLCLLTELPFLLGTIVEMFLKMPAEIMGEIEREWCCKGRVVRVSDADAAGRQRSVAVKFQYYEVLQKEPNDDLAARAKAKAARKP
jgi:hypothetical protein